MFYWEYDKVVKRPEKQINSTHLSGPSQLILLALSSLPEECWFLSNRRHISSHIKMQNTQLFLSNSVLLDKWYWRSSLCQECKSRLRSGGGKAACSSQMPKPFSVCSSLPAGLTDHFSVRGCVFWAQGWYPWGQHASSSRLLSQSWVLQFIWCEQICSQGCFHRSGN